MLLEQQLQENVEKTRSTKVAFDGIYLLSTNLGKLLFLGTIGVILFWGTWTGVSEPAVTRAFALTILFLEVPVSQLLFHFQVLAEGRVSLARIHELTRHVQQKKPSQPLKEKSAAIAPTTSTVLELCDLTYSYTFKDDTLPFVVGPIDLRINSGEITFIVGGNGSGKTSFAKLLTGLYAPTSGEIRINGVPVSAPDLDDYRQFFGIVFLDYYLSDTLVASSNDIDIDKQASTLLQKLRLAHKVQVRQGRLSTTELSQGQRKRLALLDAYLADRPVYLFDEWASDQDPQFKQVFYEQLLPELKAQGKAIVVISHDDHYFHLADRIFKLQEGRLSPY